jgi:HSP20 family protein
MLARLNNNWGLMNSPLTSGTFGELFKLLDGVSESGNQNLSKPYRTVQDKESEIIVKFFLPGFDQQEFDIQVVSDFLTVKAKRQADKLDKDDSYLRRERNTMTYDETFSLSSKVDNSKVTAKYSDGILTITLPKQESETPRSITVK